jgi:hypothetical protein
VGLTAERCAGVLKALLAHGDLTRTRDGRYVATPRLLMVRRRECVNGGNRRGVA